MADDINIKKIEKEAEAKLLEIFQKSLSSTSNPENSSVLGEAVSLLRKISQGKAQEAGMKAQADAAKKAVNVQEETLKAIREMKIIQEKNDKSRQGAKTQSEKKESGGDARSVANPSALAGEMNQGNMKEFLDQFRGAIDDPFEDFGKAAQHLGAKIEGVMENTFGQGSVLLAGVSDLTQVQSQFSQFSRFNAASMSDFTDSIKKTSDMNRNLNDEGFAASASLRGLDESAARANARMDTIDQGVTAFGTGLSFVSGFLLGAFLNALKSTQETFSNFAKIGVIENMVDLRQAAADSGMSLETFTKAITEGGSAVRLMGIREFGALSREVIESTKQFGHFGRTTEEINAATAKVAEEQRATGALRELDNRQQVKITQDYLKNVQELSALTGKQVEEIERQREADAADAQFQLKLSSMNAEEAAKMRNAVSIARETMGEDAANALKQGLLRGGNVMMSDFGAELAAMSGGAFTNDLQSLMDSARNGIVPSLQEFGTQVSNSAKSVNADFTAMGTSFGSFDEATARIVGTANSLSPERLAEAQRNLENLDNSTKGAAAAQDEFNKFMSNIVQTLEPLFRGLNDVMGFLLNSVGAVGTALAAFGAIILGKFLPKIVKLLFTDRGRVEGGVSTNIINDPEKFKEGMQEATYGGMANALSEYENPGTLKVTMYGVKGQAEQLERRKANSAQRQNRGLLSAIQKGAKDTKIAINRMAGNMKKSMGGLGKTLAGRGSMVAAGVGMAAGTALMQGTGAQDYINGYLTDVFGPTFADNVGPMLTLAVSGALSVGFEKVIGGLGGLFGKAFGGFFGKKATSAAVSGATDMASDAMDDRGRTVGGDANADKNSGGSTRSGGKSGIAKVISDIAKSLGQLGGGVGKAIAGVLRGIAGGLAAMANPATLLGLGALVLAVNGFGLALRLAAPFMEAAAPVLQTLVDTLGNVFVTGLQQIAPILKTIVPLFEKIVDTIGGVYIKAIETIPKVLKEIGGVIESVGGVVTGVINSVGGAVQGTITAIAEGIASVVNSFTEAQTAGTEATTKQIKTLSEIPADNLEKTASGLEKMKEVLDGFGSKSTIDTLASLFGDESPMAEIIKIADRADAIVVAGDAVKSLSNSLNADFGDGAKTLSDFSKSISTLESAVDDFDNQEIRAVNSIANLLSKGPSSVNQPTNADAVSSTRSVADSITIDEQRGMIENIAALRTRMDSIEVVLKNIDDKSAMQIGATMDTRDAVTRSGAQVLDAARLR